MMFMRLIVFCSAFTLVSSVDIDIQPSPVATVTEGSVLWLTCTYDLAGGTLGQLQWLGNDGSGTVATVTPSAGTRCEVTVSGYSIDCTNLASSEVRLVILTPVHGDNYSCRAFLTDSTQIGPVSTEVSVVVPVTSVTFTSPVSQTVTVTPGGSQLYTCVTGSCRPPASIDWYKDGVNVTTQTGTVSSIGDKFVTTSSLTLTGSKGDTPATVQCRASNVDGMSPVVSGDKTFVVQWAPDGPPVVSGYIQTTVIYPNDMVTLQCRQPGGNPLATLTWSGKCGTITATNSNTATEAVSGIIISVSKDYNQATCTCVSTHPQPQSQDRTQITFTVHYPPSSPVIIQTPTHPWLKGNNGTLRCSYNDGFPKLTRIEWFRDGLQTGQSTPSITLGPLSHTDNMAGYSCHVRNAFTDVKHTNLTSAVTHLNVEYKPLVTLIPTHLTVVEGQKAEVTCEAMGNPKPTLQWLRGGSSLLSGQKTSLTLTLEDVDRSATANYICRAESMSTVQGELVTERNVSLLVQYPPEVSVSVPLTVKEGDTGVRVMCQTTGEPNKLISQSWTQTIGQSFITDQFTYETATQDTIILSEVSLDDTGTYTCSVSNGIADRQGDTLQSNSTVLDVIVAPKFSGQNRNFYSKLHEPVTIKIPFYSNPPVMSTADLNWMIPTTGARMVAPVNTTFELLNGEAINLSVKGMTVAFSGQAAVMNLPSFEQSLAGIYSITIYNDGNGQQSTTNFTVTPSGPPEMPTHFQVIDTTTTSITVKWTKGFNGGHTQTFVILYGPEGGGIQQTVAVVEQLQSTYIREITGLKPNTRYLLNMYAYNLEGNTSLSSAANIISKTQEADPGTAMSAIAGGVGGSVVVLLIITVIAIVLYRRRKTGGAKDKSQRSDAALFNPDHNEEEDGMKRNILYESAGPYRPESPNDENADNKNQYAVVDKRNKNLAGAEYAEVIPKKNRKGKADTPAENGDIYAEVQKNGKEKGNGKEKENGKEKGNGKEKENGKEKGNGKEKENGKEKGNGKEKENGKEKGNGKEKENGKEKGNGKEKKKVGKWNKKEKKTTSEGQTGTVYENVGATGGKPEELYANADDKTKPVKSVPEDPIPSRKKNQEGLVYLDVEFKETQNGTRQAVIHGIENRNDYALVDFTKSAEPLPEEDVQHTH